VKITILKVQRVFGHALTTASQALRRALAQRSLRRQIPPGSRIHLGCGPNRFVGWINIDIDSRSEADIVHDLRLGLPLLPGSASLIYSEHVLEHLTLADGCRLLRDCREALEAGGVIRIAMPDLRSVVTSYLGDWRDQAWLHDEPDFEYIDSAAHMLNVAMREWGHVYVYDRDDLSLRLAGAGFINIREPSWGDSDVSQLRDRETRTDSKLILEAVAG